MMRKNTAIKTKPLEPPTRRFAVVLRFKSLIDGTDLKVQHLTKANSPDEARAKVRRAYAHKKGYAFETSTVTELPKKGTKQ